MLGLLAATFLAVGCAALVPRGERAKRLHEAARSLVPPDVRIVAEEQGDCVELAPSPSCVLVYFISPRPLAREERARLVREAANAGGRKATDTHVSEGGTKLSFERKPYVGFVNLRADERSAKCYTGEPTKDCADFVTVERW